MRNRRGFTLVELAVVIVIIGVLAAFGVPKFLNSVEKSKAAEAFNYLSAIQGSQERYLAQNGVYAAAITSLDITLPAPQYFTVGSITATARAPAARQPGRSSSIATRIRAILIASYGTRMASTRRARPFLPTRRSAR